MKNKNILIIVAHTDDETIGCGGTICKHILEGFSVYAMSFTDGISSRLITSKKLKEQRYVCSEIFKISGFKWVKNLNFPDNQLDKIPF